MCQWLHSHHTRNLVPFSDWRIAVVSSQKWITIRFAQRIAILVELDSVPPLLGDANNRRTMTCTEDRGGAIIDMDTTMRDLGDVRRYRTGTWGTFRS